MINGYIILGVLLGLPLALGLFFRVSASHLFFSVMAGELLGRYFGGTVDFMISAALPGRHLGNYAEPAVIFLPVLLTALFLRKSISRGKTLLHFLPLLITGVVLAAFVLPLLPETAQDFVAKTAVGRELLDTTSLIIGAVVLLQLIALWLLNNSTRHRGRH